MSLLVVIILVSPLNNFKATVPNTSHSKDIYYIFTCCLYPSLEGGHRTKAFCCYDSFIIIIFINPPGNDMLYIRMKL